QRPSCECVFGVLAEEALPDFDIPGRCEPGVLPELVDEVGLVVVTCAGGNVTPVDGCGYVNRKHGGGKSVAARQPLRRDADDVLEPLRQVGAAGAGCHAEVT